MLHLEADAGSPEHAEWAARAGATCVAFALAEDWPAAHAAVREAVCSGPDAGLPLLRCWLRASIGLFPDGTRDILDIKLTDELGIPTLHGQDTDVDAAIETLTAIVATARTARLRLARARGQYAQGQYAGDALAGLTSADRVTLGWQLCLGVADWARTHTTLGEHGSR